MRALAALLPLLALAPPLGAQVPEIPPAEAPCAESPEPARWLDAGTPDVGRAVPLVSSHRGALTLAPENTIYAYRYAFAYEVALIEVDVRQTLDGRFVGFHDQTIDAKTDGEGTIEERSYAEGRALNAADYEPWIGSVYDPAQIVSLEEVLELAAELGHGIEFDNKSVTDYVGFAALVNQYPEVLKRSIINLPPPLSLLVRALIPEARFIYNTRGDETPAELFLESEVASVFGSRLDEYSAEKIAAIHDGCGLVMPHSYDEGGEGEAAEILRARDMGADGVQTNQPALARALLAGPVPTRLLAEASNRICLVNANNGMGLSEKPLRLLSHQGEFTLRTALAGCAQWPADGAPDQVVFDGDASAAAAQWGPDGSRAAPIGRGGSPGLLSLTILLLWGSARLRLVRVLRGV